MYNVEFCLSTAAQDELSLPCQRLLVFLLRYDPDDRISAIELRESEWLDGK